VQTLNPRSLITCCLGFALLVALVGCSVAQRPADVGQGATTGAPATAAAQTWPRSKVPTDTFVGGSTDPATLDPAHVYQLTGAELVMSLYDSLLAFKREQPTEFVPALATEWTVSPDALTYTFKVRPGVKFHAGGTLEAHDAAYSIQRVMLSDASNGPAWMYLRPILGVSAIKDLVLAKANQTVAAGAKAPAMEDLPDAAKVAACQTAQDAVVADDAAGTVTIHLHAPTPWFLQLVATWIGSVVDKEWMVEQGDWDGTCASWTKWYDIPLEKSVLYGRENGTGPYTLGNWKKKESITLEGNEGYWRTEPA
jgi:peptide/nickel transport system substrate-binding protein